MAAKFYTTIDAVSAYLGTAFTSDQEVQATALLPIAENFIDVETQGNGGWLNGPIVSEQYDLANSGHKFYLRSTPVASVESIYRRTLKVGDTPILLVAGTDYELLNPSTGEVLLAEMVAYSNYRGYGFYGDPAWNPEWGNIGGIALTAPMVALVSYTPVQTVPPLITQCATEIVAYWLQNNIHPERYGVGAEKTGMESVTYAKMITDGCFPANIERYFNDYNRVSF